MEFELITEGIGDDYAFGAEDIDYEYPTFEGDESERCGICMDVVVDRGVLDCCQHWFCFACIDNWASITNLCPLCQSEFQLITCVPVYDTIGSSQPDEDSYSRDDNWSIEGKSNSLSFPSYYIDENAVSCLDGAGCKIRSQSANVEEGPDLDTSIACDSCDLWYHAICVGFDPDGSCENSWLCPRCLIDETSQKSRSGPSNSQYLESSSHESSVDATFHRKVSVSVADDGETAVVVSIIDGNLHTEVPSENISSDFNVTKDLEIGNRGNEETNQIISPSSNVRDDMDIDTSSGDANCKMEKQLSEKIIKKPKIEAVELDLSLSEGTSSALMSNSLLLPETRRNSKDKLADSYETTGEVEEKNVPKEIRLPADRKLDKKKNAVGNTGAKRKQRDESMSGMPWESKLRQLAYGQCGTQQMMEKTHIKDHGILENVKSAEDRGSVAGMQNSISTKKVKTERSHLNTGSEDQANEPISDNSRNLIATAGSKDDTLRKQKATTTDIKDIVQGTFRRPPKRLEHDKNGDKSSGLRVKKIMRRANEDKDSSILVQNLRKEIRDAIRNRSSKEHEDNLFDPKLLAAFRTALAGQPMETKRPPPLDLKAKKALLQKGTVRENLTKKIYGIGGKRKRSWTRDCEIEFWKHRCLKISKPEKIETLKSVLTLLRKGPENTDIKKENDVNAPSSILSRLYVADASVFPRKDDIKPLSAIKATTDSLVDSKGPKLIVQSKMREAAPMKINQSKSLDRSSKSAGVSLVMAKNDLGTKSDDVKIDKKKWALEVLARKTAVSGKNDAQGQDNAVLKGNYPLLAQLSVEMRPVLAPSRHNKIPISIRQAQLYRLTEHFLRKTNIPVTHPTAEIELAVADAINVEKAVANRSNSKLVYVNLCSQELRNRSNTLDSAKASDSNPTVVNGDSSVTGNVVSISTEVDDALRIAGLLSDTEDNEEEVGPSKRIDEDGPDNIFEIDSQPELDIYGDFEYDMEDDDIIGVNELNLKPSKLQQDESKLKLVFSTFDSKKSDTTWRFEDHESENTNEDEKIEQSCPKSSLLEGGEDEILGECEELYGPDKEPLINKYPELKPLDLVPENIVSEADRDQGSKSKLSANASEVQTQSNSENLVVPVIVNQSSGGSDSQNKPPETVRPKEKKSCDDKKQQSGKRNSVFKKVEAYIKEHVRPLCKSGVITVEQYRWAVAKTTDKIMKYHSKDSNANFLIKEGEKVKKLAEQYVESAQKVENNK